MMGDEFEPPTNVMGSDVIRELTERIRRPSTELAVAPPIGLAPTLAMPAVAVEKSPDVAAETPPQVVEMEAPPEEPSQLIALTPEPEPIPLTTPLALAQLEARLAPPPPQKPAPTYRWVWPAIVITVALVLGFHGGTALTPLIVFLTAHGSAASAVPASGGLPQAPAAAPPKVALPPVAMIAPKPAVALPAAKEAAPPPRHKHHHRHHRR
jgi:hypothetical protein